MKTFLSGLILFMALGIQAQISTTRMGDLYLGKSKSDIEKATGQKISPTHNPDFYNQSAHISHKGVDYELSFIEGYVDGEPAVMLNSIATSSTKIKTLSGMGVGNSIDELWKTYNSYSIEVFWDWDIDRDERSKTERIFQIYDKDQPHILQFKLRNNRVYKIILFFNEGC